MCAWMGTCACSCVFMCLCTFGCWTTNDSKACALPKPHFPRGGHCQSVLFLLAFYVSPQQNFWSPCCGTWATSIFPLPSSIYLGWVPRSGDSQSNVNMILRFWGQFPTSKVTCPLWTFFGKTVLRPQEGRKEEGHRVKEMKEPGSDIPAERSNPSFLCPAPCSTPTLLLAHTSPTCFITQLRWAAWLCHPGHWFQGVLHILACSLSFHALSPFLCQESRYRGAQPVTGTNMNVLYPGEVLTCNSRTHLSMHEPKRLFKGALRKVPEIKASGSKLCSRPQWTT